MLWSNRTELTEMCFLTNVSIVISHYSVTLGGSNEHFTPIDGVSAYSKYVSGNVVGNIETMQQTW